MKKDRQIRRNLLSEANEKERKIGRRKKTELKSNQAWKPKSSCNATAALSCRHCILVPLSLFTQSKCRCKIAFQIGRQIAAAKCPLVHLKYTYITNALIASVQSFEKLANVRILYCCIHRMTITYKSAQRYWMDAVTMGIYAEHVE